MIEFPCYSVHGGSHCRGGDDASTGAGRYDSSQD